ncbi:glycoside hydrolase [Macrophomina phaseolina]|uniref:Mannan endo-1,6-alpha-mannosidase n=1 Tax=Macrophomina phaseolina TaxID=35725 RepID=A0ABQ8FQP5_9PEZI|nr:glycoside hydrolase [Macrophomina phaseolina]
MPCTRDLDITQTKSIKDVTSNIAYGMMKYYTGNNTGDVPGNLPDPYYWWHAGAMFMSMVEYWYYTGDNTYVEVTKQAILHQAGDEFDFMPANQTKSEGNDDQLFWACAVLSAAELRFPNPDNSQPSWITQAQNVFDLQASRWDEECGGGLRWQIFPWNTGYNYKNTISNGGLFQMAARLARYTGNDTYFEWANKVWDWCSSGVLFQSETDTQIILNDGTTVESNCSQADQKQWTYVYGVFLAGTAFMYNHTLDDIWRLRTEKILTTVYQTFFPESTGLETMIEVTCEPSNACDIDQSSFKAYLSRWMAVTAQLVPSTYDGIYRRLRRSAQGAATQCSGSGKAPDACGRKWNEQVWDGTTGVCEQMAALQVIGSLMIDVGNLKAPVSVATGGTSKPKSGSEGRTGAVGGTNGVHTEPVTMKEKFGAAIITILLVVATIGMAYGILV